MVGVRKAGLAALALVLGGCVLAPESHEPAVDTASNCPAVRKVSAWRNMMPPIPSGGAPLIVQVTFADLSTWQLARQESDELTSLILALEPADRDPAIATGFRERPTDPDRLRVVILCAGEEVGRDDTIISAQ